MIDKYMIQKYTANVPINKCYQYHDIDDQHLISIKNMYTKYFEDCKFFNLFIDSFRSIYLHQIHFSYFIILIILDQHSTSISQHINLTKKQIISQIKMNRIRPFILQNNIKKRQLIRINKDRLVLLILLQNYISKVFDYCKIPKAVQYYMSRYI
jgi:hypothetical protein